MKKIYDKSEIWFAIINIVIYVTIFGNLRANFGEASLYSAAFALVLSIIWIIFIKKNQLSEKYGLTIFACDKKVLYCIPFIILATVNFWGGIKAKYSGMELIYGIIAMACVGFLEEMVFRGFLFKAMEKDNVKAAIIVSAITFGAGHIVNLFTGQATMDTILQMCYAISIGFSFVFFFYKTNSLLPCIVCHSLVDITYLFAKQDLNASMELFMTYGISIFIIILTILYSIYLYKQKGNESL